jgi:hypothetical protein
LQIYYWFLVNVEKENITTQAHHRALPVLEIHIALSLGALALVQAAHKIQWLIPITQTVSLGHVKYAPLGTTVMVEIWL